MYRNELTAFRLRYDAAIARAEDARETLDGKLTLVGELRDQLERRNLSAPDAPEPKDVPLPARIGERADAIELAQAADQWEFHADAVAAEARRVGGLASLLTRRLSGEEVTLPLSVAPRRVPAVYYLYEAFPYWIVILIFVLGVITIGTSLTVASSSAVAGALALAIAIGRSLIRTRFLRRCNRASSAQEVSSGNSASNMTNWPVKFSKGWDVGVETYTGQGRWSEVEFLSDEGRRGKTKVTQSSGYTGGVILYDPKDLNAYDVKHFASRPRPNADGQWVSTFSLYQSAGVGMALVAISTWVLGLVRIADTFGF